MADTEREEPQRTEETQDGEADAAAQAVDADELREALPSVDAAQPTSSAAGELLKEKEAEVLVARTEAEDFKDRWLRAAAELENFRRRTAREYADQVARASERILRQLLEPLDNLERAVKAAQVTEGAGDGGSSDAHAALRQGIEIVYGQCVALLERENVRPMETVGNPFDANLHDALLVVERSNQTPNTVVDEVQRGYWLGDRVLRHAKVVVSKAPADQEPAERPIPAEPEDNGREQITG